MAGGAWKGGIYDGEAGRAWAWTGGSRPRRATVASWIVDAAWAHPIWSQYLVFVVHLRKEPDLAGPKKHRADVTHEFHVMALHPDPKLTPGKDQYPKYLTPANMAYQFAADSDETAAARVRRLVELVADGRLNPDTDARRRWDKIMKDAVPLVHSAFVRPSIGQEGM